MVPEHPRGIAGAYEQNRHRTTDRFHNGVIGIAPRPCRRENKIRNSQEAKDEDAHSMHNGLRHRDVGLARATALQKQLPEDTPKGPYDRVKDGCHSELHHDGQEECGDAQDGAWIGAAAIHIAIRHLLLVGLAWRLERVIKAIIGICAIC